MLAPTARGHCLADEALLLTQCHELHSHVTQLSVQMFVYDIPRPVEPIKSRLGAAGDAGRRAGLVSERTGCVREALSRERQGGNLRRELTRIDCKGA